jgi:hypothetical protein
VLLPLGGRVFALLTAGNIIVFLTVYPLTLVRWTTGDALPAALFAGLAADVAIRLVALVVVWRDLQRLSRPAVSQPA